MFRIVHTANSMPGSFICDPSAEFEPGMIAELTVIGNQVMVTVSDGTAPLGVIDDIKTRSFTNVSWNEVVIVPAAGIAGPNNSIITPVDVSAPLKKSNIIPESFISTVDLVLNPTNGLVTFIAGTPLNFDLTGVGYPNALRTIVNYTYYVPNIPGDDSTAGSHRVTVWYQRMFFQTSKFETNQSYPVKSNLYVSEKGLLTTRRPSPIHPAVAMVTSPPTPFLGSIEVFWF